MADRIRASSVARHTNILVAPVTVMRIFFSAGEPSGDLHGANLIRQLKRLQPQLECVGYGGEKMAEAGCELHENLTRLAVMWIWRVLLNIRTFLALRDRAAKYFRDHKPDAVVLIDYPGFNWHLAKAAHELKIPVFYYGAPQLWAWASWRVDKMRRWVDHVLCKLPFEQDWFRQHGCRATYIGHPYFDQLTSCPLQTKVLEELAHDKRPLVTILPGSRTQEVLQNLPAFLRAIPRIRDRVPQTRFAIASFNDAQAQLAHTMVLRSGLKVEIHVRKTQELIHAARCCMACSGSVSLEILYHAKPTVIHYGAGPLGYFMQGIFRRVKYITLVNLLAEGDLFPPRITPFDPDAPGAEDVPMPEYLTWLNRSPQLARHVVEWLTDDAAYAYKVSLLHDLRKRFAQSGASLTGAKYILAALQKETEGVPPPHFAAQPSESTQRQSL